MEAKPGQKGPGDPGAKARKNFPVMYRDNTFIKGGHAARDSKFGIRSRWDWVVIELDRCDEKKSQFCVCGFDHFLQQISLQRYRSTGKISGPALKKVLHSEEGMCAYSSSWAD